jgi:hypothetical protein
MIRKIVKIIKDNILGFIIGAILFGGIGTVVATTILSSTVSYTNNDQTTVESALDELYSKASRLDSWIDPRGLNVDGTGGNISFVYWNDDFRDGNYTSNQVPTGTGLNGTYNTRAALETAYTDWEYAPFYIKTTKVNSTISGHSLCLWYNNREFCVKPSPNGMNYDSVNSLKVDLENVFGITLDSSSCGSAGAWIFCDVDKYRIRFNEQSTYNWQILIMGISSCYLRPNGEAGCS